ncbi:FHA domain-containing protein [bacterium]|nr:MAG: FHA domain-containing protein [bacterium]
MKRVYYLYQQVNGRNFRIEEGQEISFGRAFDNTIHVDDASVSRHHAVIKWKKSTMYITDLQSTNGTNVNGEKVQDNFYYELNYTDEVKIGNVAFKVLDEESVIEKNFENNLMPAKTIALDPEKPKRTLDKNDFENNP